MADTIIGALREYFLACPLSEDHKLCVDYLPEQSAAHSIDAAPVSKILETYVSGSSLRQYLFIMRSVKDYANQELQKLFNCGFFEKLSAWLENQSKTRNLPDLGEGRTARKIEIQNMDCLFVTGPDTGKYQIQCRLIYFEKGER